MRSGEIEAIISESKLAYIPPAVLNKINAHMRTIEPLYQIHDFCCTQLPAAHVGSVEPIRGGVERDNSSWCYFQATTRFSFMIIM